MAVHVLQALTGERGLAGGRTDHEAPGHLIAGGPEEVAGALEPEHRVEDVERDHREIVRGVRGAGRGEGRGGADLVDAHVLDLAGGGLLVGQQQVAGSPRGNQAARHRYLRFHLVQHLSVDSQPPLIIGRFFSFAEC